MTFIYFFFFVLSIIVLIKFSINKIFPNILNNYLASLHELRKKQNNIENLNLIFLKIRNNGIKLFFTLLLILFPMVPLYLLIIKFDIPIFYFVSLSTCFYIFLFFA